mmetsp:Transcript_28789/g.60290  ORF Transcript_28789/g.60290 Transcript_28789/m.60290 type:complete len:88 (+) Transcript_28789:157-420(+)
MKGSQYEQYDISLQQRWYKSVGKVTEFDCRDVAQGALQLPQPGTWSRRYLLEHVAKAFDLQVGRGESCQIPSLQCLVAAGLRNTCKR